MSRSVSKIVPGSRAPKPLAAGPGAIVGVSTPEPAARTAPEKESSEPDGVGRDGRSDGCALGKKGYNDQRPTVLTTGENTGSRRH